MLFPTYEEVIVILTLGYAKSISPWFGNFPFKSNLGLQPESPKPALAGSGSTFVIETGLNQGPVAFLKNSFISFIYSLLGPFPWQLNGSRQIVSLAETIPWYVLIATFLYLSWKFIVKHGINSYVKIYKPALPLLIFAVLALGALSLFINNYGIIARIRIPMFICLASAMCLVFNYYDYRPLAK